MSICRHTLYIERDSLIIFGWDGGQVQRECLVQECQLSFFIFQLSPLTEFIWCTACMCRNSHSLCNISHNLVWTSVCIELWIKSRRHAACKNDNSIFFTFELSALDILPHIILRQILIICSIVSIPVEISFCNICYGFRSSSLNQ